jgi:hypothetical protein
MDKNSLAYRWNRGFPSHGTFENYFEHCIRHNVFLNIISIGKIA